LSTNAIARRYAKALILIAVEHGAVERYYDELAAFSDALSSNAEVGDILASPGYRIEAKREIVREIAAKREVSRTVGDFLFLLLEKKRLDQLPHIIFGYRSFADDTAGILRSTVTSALPLTEEQLGRIRGALEKGTGKKIILGVATDPLLIGGVVTRIGDKVFDGSIRTQLAKIQDILQKG
jgi:F-type H+-transporting ATPase subunit delta